jgi:hypothetical protein
MPRMYKSLIHLLETMAAGQRNRSFGIRASRDRRRQGQRRWNPVYLSYNASSDGGEQRDRHYAEVADWLKDRYAEYGKTMTYFR